MTKQARPPEGNPIGGSVYRKAFRQGATLVPRMLCLVERQAVGRLGANTAAPAVRSRRSSQEKQPWKGLPAIEGNVDAEFRQDLDYRPATGAAADNDDVERSVHGRDPGAGIWDP